MLEAVIQQMVSLRDTAFIAEVDAPERDSARDAWSQLVTVFRPLMQPRSMSPLGTALSNALLPEHCSKHFAQSATLMSVPSPEELFDRRVDDIEAQFLSLQTNAFNHCGSMLMQLEERIKNSIPQLSNLLAKETIFDMPSTVHERLHNRVMNLQITFDMVDNDAKFKAIKDILYDACIPDDFIERGRASYPSKTAKFVEKKLQAQCHPDASQYAKGTPLLKRLVTNIFTKVCAGL